MVSPTIASPRFSDTEASFFRVLEVRAGLDNSPGALRRVPALEDPRADEHTVAPQLHQQGDVRRSGQPTRSKGHNREPPELGSLLHQVQRRPDVAGVRKEFVLIHGLQPPALPHDGTAVAHRLDHVTGTGLTLHPDHAGPLSNAAQGLPQVARPAHEGHREAVLVDVVLLVSHRQHLTLVDVVHTQGLDDLRLGEVPDPHLGHHGDGHRRHDTLDHRRVRHARNTTISTDVGGDMRSKAMTATAPASSAILACSGVVTSMITPPSSCCAIPFLTREVPTLPAGVARHDLLSVSGGGRGRER
eukprot:Sspe_Gene.48952::Locus_25915_Transcript_2_2_Confidence_0.750_Length_1135::g.48952::m.48952